MIRIELDPGQVDSLARGGVVAIEATFQSAKRNTIEPVDVVLVPTFRGEADMESVGSIISRVAAMSREEAHEAGWPPSVWAAVQVLHPPTWNT